MELAAASASASSSEARRSAQIDADETGVGREPSAEMCDGTIVLKSEGVPAEVQLLERYGDEQHVSDRPARLV